MLNSNPLRGAFAFVLVAANVLFPASASAIASPIQDDDNDIHSPLNQSTISSGFHNSTKAAGSALDKLEANKTLALASFIINITLASLLLSVLLQLWKIKRESRLAAAKGQW